MSNTNTKKQVYYSPDDLEEREWITPDEFIARSGKYEGQRFRMLYDGSIIRVSKNGSGDVKTD